jgi:hypothetical protein
LTEEHRIYARSPKFSLSGRWMIMLEPISHPVDLSQMEKLSVKNLERNGGEKTKNCELKGAIAMPAREKTDMGDANAHRVFGPPIDLRLHGIEWISLR